MIRQIPFPDDYQDSLESEKKNMTIRVDAELGQYKQGDILEACSYRGDAWNIMLRISEVTPMSIDDLPSKGVPKEEILRICIESQTDQVEVVRFEVLQTPQFPHSNLP